jgi:tripartite-type tricarboxylate transporter receptor subunit TctC
MPSFTRFAAGLALAAVSTAAFAQTWPTKPVRIMVGASPGGGTDIIARMLAEKYQAVFGQPFIVENRPGASNTIATDIVAKAPPDGYTMVVATNTAQSIAPHLLKLPYDPLKDIAPVALVVVVPNVLVVNTDVPAKNVKELIALIKTNPDKYSYGSSGTGSTQHLAGEAFAYELGLKMVHVPYKGSSQALADLVGGQIQLNFDTTSSAMGHIKGGKARPLAVMTAKRSPQLPEVPTLAESGVTNVEMSTWYGLFVTAGTPQPVIDRLHAETTKILKLPDVQKRLEALAGEPGNMTPAQLGAMNKAEFERFGALIRAANIKIQQ